MKTDINESGDAANDDLRRVVPFVVGLVIAGLASSAFGQASTPPTFEVASVKQNNVGINEGPGRGPENFNRTPTSLSMENVRLSSALKWAYQLQEFQISGPPWLQSNRYDILARTETPVSEGDLRRRLQSLLADRFKLVSHHEIKVLPAFELIAAKDGPKLEKAVAGDDSRITAAGNTATFLSTSISELADRISRTIGAPVVDMTGLKDRYNFTFDMSPYLHGERVNPDDMRDIISQAVQDQLGLRLVSKKLFLDVLIIDHVERVPTAN